MAALASEAMSESSQMLYGTCTSVGQKANIGQLKKPPMIAFLLKTGALSSNSVEGIYKG